MHLFFLENMKKLFCDSGKLVYIQTIFFSQEHCSSKIEIRRNREHTVVLSGQTGNIINKMPPILGYNKFCFTEKGLVTVFLDLFKV